MFWVGSRFEETTEAGQNSSELLSLVSSTKMMTWHLRLFEAMCVVFLLARSGKVLLTCSWCSTSTCPVFAP